MTTRAPDHRWFHLTPDRVVIALLIVQTLLWLSERFGWLPWHKGYAVLTVVAAVGVAILLILLWFAASLLFRRRFQFSIWSILALTVVVALPCSWLATEMEQARRQSRIVAEIRELHGRFENLATSRTFGPYAQPAGPVWLRRVLGKDFFLHVDSVLLMMPTITDTHLERLKEVSRLRQVYLWGTQVTDAGLEHLKGLNHLQTLSIWEDQVTDAGVEHLKGLSQLESVGLWDTQVTAAGMKKLQQALPNCKIER